MSACNHQVWMATLVGLLGLWPTAPRAQSGQPDETILLVGVTRGPRSDARLARALEDHLRLTGETIAPSGHLGPAERLCSDGECLEQLARREHAVLAMTVNVRDSGPQSYFLTLALVDAQRRLPVQSEAVCDTCSADELATKLNDLSDKTLHLYRQRLSNPPGPGAVPAADPGHLLPTWPAAKVLGPVPPAAGPFAQLTPGRKILAGVLGVAALGVLIPSIFWSVKDGQAAPTPCSDNPLAAQDCRYDNKALYGVGYAMTAALAGGMLLTLFLPGQTAAAQSSPPAEKAP